MLTIAGISIWVLFTLAWVIQLRTKNGAIADVAWAFSFPMMTLVYWLMSDHVGMRQVLLLSMVSLWGLRLAIYLFGRTIKEKEDSRYTALRIQWGVRHNFYMLRFYYFQATFAVILSIPFALMMMNGNNALGVLDAIGMVLWSIGLTGETLADKQLKDFKSAEENKRKICDYGLWHYSRHPNYFFEWLIWIAYFIMALSSPYGWISIICPLAMLFFLTKVTGIPYTEAHMLKTRGVAFTHYQQSTSAFIPLPKKKSNHYVV